MAFTFDQFATQAAAKKGFVNTVAQGAASVFNKTVDTSSKAIQTAKGVMPVTNNKFNDFVSKANGQFNNLEKENWKRKMETHMIAQYVGMALPNDEEMEELHEEFKAQEAAELAMQQQQVLDPVAAVMNDPEAMEKLFGMFQQFQATQQPQEKPLETIQEIDAFFQAPGTALNVEQELTQEQFDAAMVQEEEVVPVQTNPADEWKPCTDCGKELHVTYDSDTCRDCRQKARQAVALQPSKPAGLRVNFDAAVGPVEEE